MQTGSQNVLSRVLRRAKEISQTWPNEQPAFKLQTGWSQSYDRVLSREYSFVLDESGVLDRPISGGRAILAGRGGSGKSALLRRLHNRALKSGVVPVFVDLKQWTGSHYAEWADWTCDNIGDGADFLVRKFSGLGIGLIDLDRLPPDTTKLIFVDGLNEITARVGSEILNALDEIVATQIMTSVLVVDRLLRRDLPKAERWWIGSPLPLALDEVQRHLRKTVVAENDLRRLPFFLAAELRNGAGAVGRTERLRQLIQLHGGLTDAELTVLATAAFEAYRNSRSRTFPRGEFEAVAGAALIDKLQQSGIIDFNEAGGYFDHQIQHDFLAATHVASLDADDWNPDLFRALTLESSSFDAIELAFEQLAPDRADVFLQKLYDWNLYAAGYALAQARDEDNPVGTEMRTVIFAMLADKRFDAVLATRQRAGDALELMQLHDAEPFRVAADFAAICAAVQDVHSELGWFNTWKGLFASAAAAELTLGELQQIGEADSIIGWTVANVAKRFAEYDWILPALVEMLDADPSATVRWRVAHVLGAFPQQESLERLLALFDGDDDEDVRYGAIRSMVELASRADAPLRTDVGEAIRERADTIAESDRISRELRSSLLIDADAAPDDWLEFVRECVRSQFLADDRLAIRDLWRGCLNAAEAEYAPAAVLVDG